MVQCSISEGYSETCEVEIRPTDPTFQVDTFAAPALGRALRMLPYIWHSNTLPALYSRAHELSAQGKPSAV